MLQIDDASRTIYHGCYLTVFNKLHRALNVHVDCEALCIREIPIRISVQR